MILHILFSVGAVYLALAVIAAFGIYAGSLWRAVVVGFGWPFLMLGDILGWEWTLKALDGLTWRTAILERTRREEGASYADERRTEGRC